MSTCTERAFAEALELALLQHAQQLGLQVERHFADFVEQDGAAVGQFEFAGTVCDRAGESAFARGRTVRSRAAFREPRRS